ncbi:MAG: hypothetical protein ABW352_06570, partial [Polyangiales bacterium]
PDPARLKEVYQRLLHAAPAASPYDLPPPAPSSGRPWGWFTIGGAVVVSATLWLSKPEPPPALVARPEPPPSQVQRAVAPSVTKRVEPQVIPSSDWPVASPVLATRGSAARRIKRERREDAPALEAEPAPAPTMEAPAIDDAPSPSPPTAAIVESHETHASTIRIRKSNDAAASLRDEVRLITHARKALEQGDWQAAQRALDEHQLDHPVGQLHIERRALWARARCLAGDLAGARRIHAELLTLAPGTALLRGLERACPDVAVAR